MSSSSSSRRRRHSPGAAPLDDDDLLSEILLRLPSQPSSLPRASLVCKRWRRLVSDPRFFRRFRLHHLHNPPLLGFFDTSKDIFLPALETPDRFPTRCFLLRSDHTRRLGCRHGLVLDFHGRKSRTPNQTHVWDPVTGDQNRVPLPPGFDMIYECTIHGAVLRPAGDAQNFQVVLVGNDVKDKARALACVYSSDTGLWSDFISTPSPSEGSFWTSEHERVSTVKPSVLVGNCLYWLLTESSGILELDLDKHSLAVVPLPLSLWIKSHLGLLWITRAEGGGLGFIFLSGCNAQLCKRRTDCRGVSSWLLGRTIDLDKLLSLNSEMDGGFPLRILGFAEKNNVMILSTSIGAFMIHLKSLQFKKLPETHEMSCYHAFESVYAAGMTIGGEHDGAQRLHNTKDDWLEKYAIMN